MQGQWCWRCNSAECCSFVRTSCWEVYFDLSIVDGVNAVNCCMSAVAGAAAGAITAVTAGRCFGAVQMLTTGTGTGSSSVMATVCSIDLHCCDFEMTVKEMLLASQLGLRLRRSSACLS